VTGGDEIIKEKKFFFDFNELFNKLFFEKPIQMTMTRSLGYCFRK
jgi:hypothetical protein